MKNTTDNSSEDINLDPKNLSRNIIFESKVMADVLELVEKVSATNDTTVLITGESGTGKELIANNIHYNSNRRDKAFIKINCGGIHEPLLESELFGHEKGAFTGAISRKIGKFEEADGGTLFLDEVGELSPSSQVKLLRVIQERELVRLGGLATIPINVRLVTATNRDLIQDTKNDRFRKDLYYRIKVVTINMPSLRERREDIPLLIEHFRVIFNTKLGRKILISDNVIDALGNYSWPGNVRQLRSGIEEMMVTASGSTISMDDIPRDIFTDIQTEPVAEPFSFEKAKKYRELCDWILKEKSNLESKQFKGSLKSQLKGPRIWQPDYGFTGTGRDLINAIKTYRELFKDIDSKDLRIIFELLFILAPGFKKEKEASVENLLSDWDDYRQLDDSNKPPPESLNAIIHDPLPTPQITVQGKAPIKTGLFEWIKILFLIILSILLFYYFLKANPLITPVYTVPG